MSCQRITCHLLGYLHRQGQWAYLLCRIRSGALLAHYLTRLLCQDRVFSLLGPKDDHFHVAGAQRDPLVLSCALFVPLLLLYILTLMQELVLGRLNHRIARHCNYVR